MTDLLFSEAIYSDSHADVWGRGRGRGGRRVMFEYVDFLHFDFRSIKFLKLETLLLRTKGKVQQR